MIIATSGVSGVAQEFPHKRHSTEKIIAWFILFFFLIFVKQTLQRETLSMNCKNPARQLHPGAGSRNTAHPQ